MDNSKSIRFKTIAEFHRYNNLKQPEHPLISIVDHSKLKEFTSDDSIHMIFDFYSISMKKGVGKMFYGQQQYDFDEGVLFFMSPNQILRIEHNQDIKNQKRSGWVLLIHPDYLWNTSLAKTIKSYEYFDYAVNEALWLSDNEDVITNGIIQNIQQEIRNNIDKYSKQIIISQIESLLNYSERFYNRQFLTREKSNHQTLERMETLLNDYFENDELITKGLPSVQYVAEMLNISPKYLSGLLKQLTGQSTQQHIHDRLIDKAKEKLSTTNLSVSDIAYELGFEHSQSFNKLFKSKTNQSPLEFRKSFN